MLTYEIVTFCKDYSSMILCCSAAIPTLHAIKQLEHYFFCECMNTWKGGFDCSDSETRDDNIPSIRIVAEEGKIIIFLFFIN